MDIDLKELIHIMKKIMHSDQTICFTILFVEIALFILYLENYINQSTVLYLTFSFIEYLIVYVISIVSLDRKCKKYRNNKNGSNSDSLLKYYIKEYARKYTFTCVVFSMVIYLITNSLFGSMLYFWVAIICLFILYFFILLSNSNMKQMNKDINARLNQ